MLKMEQTLLRICLFVQTDELAKEEEQSLRLLGLQTMVESICLGMRLRPMLADKSKTKTAKECLPITVTANIATTGIFLAQPINNRCRGKGSKCNEHARQMTKRKRKKKVGKMHKLCADTTGNSYLQRFRTRLRRSFLWLPCWCFWVLFLHPLPHSFTLTYFAEQINLVSGESISRQENGQFAMVK